MNREGLYEHIKSRSSFLCVGLDPDPVKIPEHLRASQEGILTFNLEIIEATHAVCVAYKLNTAFYEVMGAAGWEILQKTIDAIPKTHFVIADAKRGDIGNTGEFYAATFFDTLGVDAVTVNPYMGEDSVMPFLSRKNKWAVVLGLTSNTGSADFQQMPAGRAERKLYEEVIAKAASWGDPDQLMFVVGATQANALANIRRLIPNHFILVPGVGAQGGDLGAVARAGMNDVCGLLVNSSRGILYASRGRDFAGAARKEAEKIRNQMRAFLPGIS